MNKFKNQSLKHMGLPVWYWEFELPQFPRTLRLDSKEKARLNEHQARYNSPESKQRLKIIRHMLKVANEKTLRLAVPHNTDPVPTLYFDQRAYDTLYRAVRRLMLYGNSSPSHAIKEATKDLITYHKPSNPINPKRHTKIAGQRAPKRQGTPWDKSVISVEYFPYSPPKPPKEIIEWLDKDEL